MKTIIMLLTALNLALLMHTPAQADTTNLYHDKRAIAKMTQGKAVFLVDMADAKKQAFYMVLLLVRIRTSPDKGLNRKWLWSTLVHRSSF